ncbi:PilZ domain-containing protein [Metabacillus malikii]|uniref:C-di-GMP-binding flagellar brake protein YcgR n=1 Tax=Metabacillus malikii TaxID=1504265 RepID=A0ABT9ZGK2_9BACI|nr:PilZ domain-containing protein [Metabacillus malikii]MDQ0231416.1 c-di-GMP-binding flagellar brake protein YcgR [Metabacillus malikii]
MEYLLIAQSVLILFLLFLYLRGEYLLKKKVEKSQVDEDFQTESAHVNKRMHYRLGIEDTPCSISVIGIGKTNDGKRLKSKSIKGYLDNISATGLKFTTNTDLPVKDLLTIEVDFQIKEKNYTIQGKIVRREELLEDGLYGYGVEFHQISRAQMAELSNTLLQLEAETLKKVR